jgi:hypothetical protein
LNTKPLATIVAKGAAGSTSLAAATAVGSAPGGAALAPYIQKLVYTLQVDLTEKPLQRGMQSTIVNALPGSLLCGFPRDYRDSCYDHKVCKSGYCQRFLTDGTGAGRCTCAVKGERVGQGVSNGLCSRKHFNGVFETVTMNSDWECREHYGTFGRATNICVDPNAPVPVGTLPLRHTCTHSTECKSTCCKPSRKETGAKCGEEKSESKFFYGKFFTFIGVNSGQRCIGR